MLFSSYRQDLVLSVLHPQQGHIFKLWQVYLENVDPLLKVTHVPSLQPRVIDAAMDVTKITPALEALMFSIYCMAVLSLDEAKCLTLLGENKNDALARFQLACRQALHNCSFLRSTDLDCLTALYFYLVSVEISVSTEKISISIKYSDDIV